MTVLHEAVKDHFLKQIQINVQWKSLIALSLTKMFFSSNHVLNNVQYLTKQPKISREKRPVGRS